MKNSAELAVAETEGVMETAGVAESIPAPKSMLEQAMRFGIVGVVNTGVDFGVFNLLISLMPSAKLNFLYSVFKSLSFLVAVTNSYMLNRRFTFQSTKEASAGQMSQYLIVSLVGLLINVGVATLVYAYVPPPEFLAYYWYTIAPLAGIPAGLVWNFLGYRFLVF